MSSTTQPPIRVGLVGANPTRGWGTAAHLPALVHLPEFEVVAVATTRQESADETARIFGVPLAFSRPEDLVAHPDVDLVAVTVRVPSHAAIVRAALHAGKHVFSEWPLGVDSKETRSLTGLAAAAGVVHAIGLQGLHAPGARFVRDLIEEGRIGELRSASFVASSNLASARIAQSQVWLADPAAGVTLLSIMGGHILATLDTALGAPLGQFAAVVRTLDRVTVIETGEVSPSGMPDQLGLVGTLEGGAMVSIALQGGSPPSAPSFTLQIVGAEGALTITPAQAGAAVHIGDWHIRLDGAGEPQELPVPQRYRVIPAAVPPGPPANVAALYREIARAVAEGRQPYPSFEEAVRYHDLLDAVEAASRSGERRQVGPTTGPR